MFFKRPAAFGYVCLAPGSCLNRSAVFHASHGTLRDWKGEGVADAVAVASASTVLGASSSAPPDERLTRMMNQTIPVPAAAAIRHFRSGMTRRHNESRSSQS